MIAIVDITPEGGVTVTVDSTDLDDDEETRRLAGLTLDDMLSRAGGEAFGTWLRVRYALGELITDDDTADGDEAAG